MAAYSKILPYSCYEVGHTWTPSCLDASKDIAIHGFKHSFKVYSSLYIISAILRRKGLEYYMKKLVPEILQSTLFLGTNAYGFLGSFCLWRKLFPGYIFPNVFLCGIPTGALSVLVERKDRKLLGGCHIGSAFLPALLASTVAISLERKSRRGLLAGYTTTLAIEMFTNMLIYRKILHPVKNGEVLLFSLVMAVYMFLFRMKDGLQGSTLSAIRFLVGSSELPRSMIEQNESHSKKVHFNENLHSKATVMKIIDSCLEKLRSFPKHRLCQHNNSCLSYTLEGSARMFASGYTIQCAVRLLGSLPLIIKKPKVLFSALKHRDNFSAGAFLATFSGLFRSVSCILRWVRNSDSELHAIVSGFIAGWSMLWYKSSSLALYLTSKLVEILYKKGIDAGHFPSFNHADLVIYAISTSFVFHAAVFEPHNLRPAYWKFLMKLTNGRFADMNRRLIDVYGTDASKLFPDFWPNYDPRYSNLKNPFS